MKIAVAGIRGFPGVHGGVESHCEQLYPRLAKNECDITVFTRKLYVAPNLYKYQGVALTPISCPKNKYFETFIHTFKCVNKARKLKPDILHIHAIGPSVFTPLARLFGMKVVVTHHGPDYKRKKWPLPAKAFLRFCEWIGMTFANEIIVIDSNIADDIKRKFGRNAAVIPNGVEIPLPADTDITLEKWGLQKKKYILAVGRFVPEKGFDDLIDAFNKGDFGDWKLVIAGGAQHEDRYSRSLKEKAAKNNNIILTGFLTGQYLHELYSYAGLFVLPSYYEGLPMVLLEAMSYGLSCIASDIPANRGMELSDDRFFRAGDIHGLTKRIKEFINKPWEEERKKEQIEMIAEKYNWDNIVVGTLKVYKQVMG
jgi:glycosyltransferase involved in cell wall biosynthesis